MMSRVFLVFLIFSTYLFAISESKKQFYNDMQKEFKQDFTVWGVQFDKKTLLIRFSKNDLLYKRGQINLQRSFELILKDFFPRFLPIILKHKENVGKVIIKGHTSSESRFAKTKDEKYLRNLILSEERAQLLLEYVKNLSDPVVVKNSQYLDDFFTSKGASSSEPILDKNGKENKEKSRRTEIVIVFDDSDDVIIEDEEPMEEIPLKKVFTLEHYVKRVLVENPTISEKFHYLKSIQQAISKAKANFRPTIALNFSHTHYTESDPDKQDSSQSRDITVRYNIFNGFKDKNEQKISEYNYESSIFAKEQIENEIIYSTAEAYLTLQKTNEVFALSRANYEDYIAWEEKAKIKFQNGLLSLKNYSKIQARSLSRYMNFEEDTKRYLDSITTMQKLLDFNDKELNYFIRPNPYSEYFDNVTLAIEDSKEYSPFVKEAEANIQLYRSKMQQANVNFYPTVDFVAKKSVVDDNYEDSSKDTQTNETTFAIEARLQLYSGGKDVAEYKTKLAEYRQKIKKRDSVLRDVIYKVDMSFNKLNLLTIKEEFLKDLVVKREEEYVAANYDYKFAKIDENGLLDVVDSVYNARRQFLENRFDMITAKYKVLEQIGIIKNIILEGE